jgi:2',3'-cyclic-nucleotide 2'-phosphodiesterase/3'-nucleotidase
LAAKQPELPPPPAKITIMATSRVNGHIIDWDYKFPRTAEFGLVRVATLVKEQRINNGNTILIDQGSMLSGSALTDYFATVPSKLANPMITMYNVLGYDAVVLGPGELAYGPAYLSKVLPTANFPILSANAQTTGKTWPAFKPYTIKEFNVGKDKKKELIRIGIIGTSSISADAPDHPGLTFTDQTAAIENVIKKIGAQVDAIVIVKNDGIEVNGIAAATHGRFGVAAANPGKFGSSISKTDLTFEKIGKRWLLTNTETANIYAVTANADKNMSDTAWPYHDATLQHLAAEKKAAEKLKSPEQPSEQQQVQTAEPKSEQPKQNQEQK